MTLEELNERIRTLMVDEPGARQVAQKVLADLSVAELRDVLGVLLPGHVASVMTSAHRAPRRGPDQARRGRTPGIFETRDGRKFASARQRDLADWEALTGASLAAPGGGRKHFGDFTAAEVQWLVGQRDAQAEALRRRADQYRRVAVAMKDGGVDLVKDLKPEVLVTIMAEPDREPVE
jgi:hypothetical protein